LTLRHSLAFSVRFIPHRPICLPNKAHKDFIQFKRATKSICHCLLFRIRSLRVSRGTCFPKSTNHYLYHKKLEKKSCYSEENFGGNQQLNNSMSLSPLYSTRTNDLHVSTVTVLHRNFFRLQPGQVKIIIFRVSGNELHGMIHCKSIIIHECAENKKLLPSIRII